MISHTEAQEMHECIGASIEAIREYDDDLRSLQTVIADLLRARELAALVVADTDDES